VLVLEAARTLRRDHDPRRALALLEQYVQRNPDGDLIEETLALTIQARSQLDDPAAAAVADDYLARFPAGRFRDEAVRAQTRFADRMKQLATHRP
jgi:hypothetical protein